MLRSIVADHNVEVSSVHIAMFINTKTTISPPNIFCLVYVHRNLFNQSLHQTLIMRRFAAYAVVGVCTVPGWSQCWTSIVCLSRISPHTLVGWKARDTVWHHSSGWPGVRCAVWLAGAFWTRSNMNCSSSQTAFCVAAGLANINDICHVKYTHSHIDCRP